LDKLEAVGDPDLRAAFLYARSQDRPVTANELAEEKRIHRNVARSRLERLVTAGLLVPGYERRSGRTGPGAGRPAKTYTVAPELEALEFPTGRYETLIGVLLDALPKRDRLRRLGELGVALGEELAGASGLAPAKTYRPAVERLCTAIRGLGYQASLLELSEAGALIETATCPLRPLVHSRPEVAELDRGMWAGLAARAFEGASAEQFSCETQACLQDDAPCRVLIALRSS
jgi:predicted ArsR family transcriptional regulator